MDKQMHARHLLCYFISMYGLLGLLAALASKYPSLVPYFYDGVFSYLFSIVAILSFAGVKKHLHKLNNPKERFLIAGIVGLPLVYSLLAAYCYNCEGIALTRNVGYKELYGNCVIAMLWNLVIVYLDYALQLNGGFLNQMPRFVVALPFPLTVFMSKTYEMNRECYRRMEQFVWLPAVLRVVGTIIQVVLQTYDVKFVWKLWVFEIEIINMIFFFIYLGSSFVSGFAVKMLCKATPSDLQLKKFWSKITFTILLIDLLLIQDFVVHDVVGVPHFYLSGIILVEMILVAFKNLDRFPASSAIVPVSNLL